MKPVFTFIFLVFSSLSIGQSVEPFLESIVSKFPNVRDLTINGTNDEAIFSAQSAMGDMSALISVKTSTHETQEAKVLAFSGRYFDLEPFFSIDGLILYFVSNRPLDQTSEIVKDFDIWYVQRTDTNADWSKPVNMGSPVNSEMDEFYPAITDSNNLYFTVDNPQLKQKDNIYVCQFINGNYTPPKQLGSGINSDGYEFNAFVSSDESFMIYTCYNREGSFGSGDLYISTKTENDEWSPAINLGNQINSDKMDYCPFVDERTNTLYFTSKRNALKPIFDSQVDLKALLDTFNRYENGLSRLYRVPLEGIVTKNSP